MDGGGRRRTHVTQATDTQYEEKGVERDTALGSVTQGTGGVAVEGEGVDAADGDEDEGVTARRSGCNDDGAAIPRTQ